MVGFNGSISGSEEGIPLTTAANDQQKPTITYNSDSQEIMVCWEDFRNGTDFDIYCSIIDEINLTY